MNHSSLMFSPTSVLPASDNSSYKKKNKFSRSEHSMSDETKQGIILKFAMKNNTSMQ